MCEETCENVREETSLKKRSVTARHYISVTALHIISMTALHYIGNQEKMIGQYRCTEIKKGLKMQVLKLTVKTTCTRTRRHGTPLNYIPRGFLTQVESAKIRTLYANAD